MHRTGRNRIRKLQMSKALVWSWAQGTNSFISAASRQRCQVKLRVQREKTENSQGGFCWGCESSKGGELDGRGWKFLKKHERIRTNTHFYIPIRSYTTEKDTFTKARVKAKVLTIEKLQAWTHSTNSYNHRYALRHISRLKQTGFLVYVPSHAYKSRVKSLENIRLPVRHQHHYTTVISKTTISS